MDMTPNGILTVKIHAEARWSITLKYLFTERFAAEQYLTTIRNFKTAAAARTIINWTS